MLVQVTSSSSPPPYDEENLLVEVEEMKVREEKKGEYISPSSSSPELSAFDEDSSKPSQPTLSRGNASTSKKPSASGKRHSGDVFVAAAPRARKRPHVLESYAYKTDRHFPLVMATTYRFGRKLIVLGFDPKTDYLPVGFIYAIGTEHPMKLDHGQFEELLYSNYIEHDWEAEVDSESIPAKIIDGLPNDIEIRMGLRKSQRVVVIDNGIVEERCIFTMGEMLSFYRHRLVLHACTDIMHSQVTRIQQYAENYERMCDDSGVVNLQYRNADTVKGYAMDSDIDFERLYAELQCNKQYDL